MRADRPLRLPQRERGGAKVALIGPGRLGWPWWPIALTLTNGVTRVTRLGVSEVPGVRLVVAAMAVMACGLAHADLCGMPDDAQVVATIRAIAVPDYLEVVMA